MISLERLNSMQEGEFVIYESPAERGRFYSGVVVEKLRGTTRPLYLRIVPADKRIKPIQLAIGDKNIGKPRHLVRDLAFNWNVAFKVSREDLTGTRDLSQDLYAQTEGTDLHTQLAAERLVEQLAEVRENFDYAGN